MSQHKTGQGAMRGKKGGPMGGMGRPVEKAKDFKGTLKRLIRYLKPHRMNLLIVLIFAIASTSFAIASPRVMGKATNKLQSAFMVRKMLPEVEKGQNEGVKKITEKMGDYQKDIVNQISSKMTEVQTKPKGNNSSSSEMMTPEQLEGVKKLLQLPMLNSISDADKKLAVLNELFDILSIMPDMSTTDSNSDNKLKMDKESIKSIKEFINLPKLSTLTDANQKADVTKRFLI